MNQEDYQKLVSGRSTGLGPSLLRLLLGIAACGYSLVIRLRNLLYSRGWFKAHRTNATVISIGNITAGGTGKTPLVAWLCNEIAQNPKPKTKNRQCAILTRGYKTARGALLDEPAILAESCPDAKVVVNPDRVAGAAEAVAFGANVLIMDDGFQHRRLARDLDIVAIDATMPFGYGKILPAGLLREPVIALKRADAVVITRSDQAPEAQLTDIEKTIRGCKSDMVIARSIHAPLCAIDAEAKQIDLEELKGKKVFAFCGIGNPHAFLNTVKDLGVNLLGSQVFDDHHHYTNGCLAEICGQAQRLGADLALTTQ
ncbi:MAG: tetraacyldisaccharide 4'-kinase, partial [Phycisphaerae bacterium]|nr:tetraacyldisaccharide 4'-kinase [Phycisphaerae bacterium]